MKLKEFAKRVKAFGFAAFVAAACLSGSSTVYAGVDDYPPEVKFPISVLDFRQDNLLFEWSSGGDVNSNPLKRFSFYDGNDGDPYKGGKGLVNDVLDSEGYPVYKDNVLIDMAGYVRYACNHPAGTNLNALTTSSNNLNPLCVRNMIKKEYRRDVLTLEYARRYMNGSGKTIPESYIKWKIDDAATHTYAIHFDSLYGQHGKFPVVFETTGGTEIPLYSIEYNGIVMIADGVRVSQTLTGLTKNKNHKIQYSKADNMNVYVNGTPAANGASFKPNADGSMKISIERNGNPSATTIAGAATSNYIVEAEDCSPSGSALIATGAAFSPAGALNTNVRWEGAGTLTSQFECSTAGDYQMNIYYACGVTSSYKLDVNGTTQTVECPATGDYYTPSAVPKTVTVRLAAGTNIIMFSDDSGAAPTLDRFEIEKGGAQIGSSIVADNGWYNFEAEDCLTGGGAVDSLFCSGGKYAGGIDKSSLGKCTINFHSDVAGIRRVRFYYCSQSGSERRFKVTINDGTSVNVSCPNTGSWNCPLRAPLEQSFSFVKGDNKIEITYPSGQYAPNLDRIEIESELSGSKVEELTLTSTESDYPLGTLEASKEKYNNNPELGWFDMTTCMDYAYFMTHYFWRPHSSLNTPFTKYDTLLFKKREYEGNWAYEFAAATHKRAPLIYDAAARTIKNGTGSSGGYMFILEEAPHVSYDGKDMDPKLKSDTGEKKNFHFSIKSHSQFVFNSEIAQYFDFYGDDDVYIFVNKHLVLDLGGAHSEAHYKINLYDLYMEQESGVKDYGLIDGEVVDFDMFYLERHSTGSNFYALMNIMLAPDSITDNVPYETLPYGYKIDLNYAFTTQRQMTTNKNFRFSDDFGNQVGSQGFVLAPGVTLKDNTLTCTVTKPKEDPPKPEDPKDPDNFEKDEARSKTFTFVDPSSPSATELAALKTYFENLALYLNETVTLGGLQYDTGTKPYYDYTETNPANPDKRDIVFKTYAKYDAWMDGADEKTDGDTSKSHPVGLLLHEIMVKTDQKDNQKKQLASYGAFTLTRDDETAARYVNKPADTKYKSEIGLKGYPEGSYTLKLDTTVLHNYDVYIYKGPEYEITEDDVPAAELDPANQLTLNFEATYDPVSKDWNFWDCYFVLRAKRDLLELKDLT